MPSFSLEKEKSLLPPSELLSYFYSRKFPPRIISTERNHILQQMGTPPDSPSLSSQFPDHWQTSTADRNLTLHGFRRFKTTHLLNLRYLEAEIARLDHLLYQVGLGLELEISSVDRLGLKHCQKDDGIPCPSEVINRELIERLRRLLKDYGEQASKVDRTTC